MHCEAVRGTLGQHLSPRRQGQLTELIGSPGQSPSPSAGLLRAPDGEQPRHTQVGQRGRFTPALARRDPVNLSVRGPDSGSGQVRCIMTVLADFIVANNLPADAPAGHWKSVPFEAGGRLIRTDSHGAEQFNAYAALALDSPTGGTDVYVRVIVNGHPLPQLVAVMEASQRTAVVAFPASYLHPDSSRDEAAFIVLHVICHFRQES
jgi:hypothetical protein